LTGKAGSFNHRRHELRKSPQVAEDRGERKWRPQCVVKRCRTWSFEFDDNPFNGNILRFNPIQIAEWLQDLLDCGVAQSQKGLEEYMGIDRTRVGQFLRLRRLSEATRARLRGQPGLNEFQLRRLVDEGTMPLKQTC
jgi:hypothetical protein